MSTKKFTRRALVAAVGALGVLTVGPTTAAHADAHTHDMYLMCTQLATNPTLAGVTQVIAGWIAQEGNSAAANRLGADTLMDAVTYTCPEYLSLVVAWVDAHSTSTSGGTNV